MSFKIYYEPVKVDNDVYLRFMRVPEGIRVVAVNVDGDIYPQGNILVINDTGTIKRYASVNTAIGLQIDEIGKVKEVY